MSIVIERGIIDDNDNLFSVRRHGDNIIIVTWPCGDNRYFTLPELGDVIADLDTLSDYPDVWLGCRDMHAGTFFARVVNGVLFADTHPGITNACGVPWPEMRKTLFKMMKSREPTV